MMTAERSRCRGQAVEDITIRHRFEDCIDIPPNHEYAIPYYLAPKQLRHMWK
jgi:hypothetical protein